MTQSSLIECITQTFVFLFLGNRLVLFYPDWNPGNNNSWNYLINHNLHTHYLFLFSVVNRRSIKNSYANFWFFLCCSAICGKLRFHQTHTLSLPLYFLSLSLPLYFLSLSLSLSLSPSLSLSISLSLSSYSIYSLRLEMNGWWVRMIQTIK